MLPSGSDLTYFIEVAKEQSVSKAAQRLGLSQPSVTLALKRLEESLEVQLFIRTKKGVQLTNAGKELFVKAQKLLDDWHALKASTYDKYATVTGTYRMGCHPSVGLYSLKYFIPELMNTYPTLDLKIVHDHSKEITQKVIDLEVDVALVVNPTRHPDLIIKKIFNDEVSLWRSKKGSVEDVLICDPSLIQSTAIIKKLSKNKIDHKRVITSESLENIASLVHSGSGIGIIPGRVVKEFNKDGLEKVSDSPVYKDEICLIYRVENKNVKAIEAITKTIIKCLT